MMGPFHEDHITTQSSRRLRVLGRNGGTAADMRESILAHAEGAYSTDFYVPMTQSLPAARQAWYAQHEDVQQKTFEHLTAVSEIMQIQKDYACTYNKDPYWDNVPELYNSKNKLHLRKGPWMYFIENVIGQLPRGALLLCLGWNSSDPVREFQVQLDILDAIQVG